MTNPEPLDIEQPAALIAYLRQTGRIDPHETPIIRSLAGGVSSRTVYVEQASGEAWVLKQALEKLRVAVDWFSDPQRIHCEATALRWLSVLAPTGAVPDLIFEDEHEHILAMRAVPQPHINWKTLLLAGGLNEAHVAAFGQLLGTIHRNAYQRRAEIDLAFRSCAFFESLRLEPYYRYTALHVPAAAGFLNALIDNTLAQRLTLVHGDYSPKNVLIYHDQLVLLDHEVAHVGDPAFDLGFALTHLLSKAHHLAAQRSALALAADVFWETYARTISDLSWHADLEPRVVRHTLACLLARVAGRSPLEYLDTAERVHQRDVVLSILPNLPQTMAALIARFTARL